MKTYKSTAIVCRRIKYSESSIIIDLYTRERGMRSFIVNGVRSRKSRIKAGLFQLMTQLDIVAYDRDDGKLARLKEVKLHRHYRTIPFDVIRSSVGTFMLEICRNSIREDEAYQELYDYISRSYMFLDTSQHNVANVHIVFMWEMSRMLGFMPDVDYSEGAYFDLQEGRFVQHPVSEYYLEPETATYIRDVIVTEVQDAHHLNMSKQMRNDILQASIDYYRLHLPQFSTLKSLPVLQAIM